MKTPTLIMDLKKIKENYENFKKHYEHVFYAIKANNHPKILKFLAELGCGAEVCSMHEFMLAKKHGFKKIILNGHKTIPEIRKAVKKGVWLINADSEEELKEIKKHEVLKGIRLKNKKVGMELPKDLEGIDCISTHERVHDERTIKELKKYKTKLIDIGGGFSEEPELKEKHENIIVEPGRGLVGNAGTLLVKVIRVKEDNIIINTGLNFLNKITKAKYIVNKHESNEKKNHVYNVYGIVPANIDCIGKHNLPEIKEGDLLEIKNCGAYTYSLASNFVTKAPRIFLKHPSP